jgi:hypothetical protein
MGKHFQVGSVHFYLEQCSCDEGFEHKITIKSINYKHTILHGEKNQNEAKLQAIEAAFKLGLISKEDLAEANLSTP